MEPLIPHQTTTTIIKGKRTKRQRPNINNLTHSPTSYNALPSSPSSHSTIPPTAEDEDTANCLILLSKGHNINISPPNIKNINTNIQEPASSYQFTSKRFIQTHTDATNGSTGVYVYACKTCNRTFPSFQALGGHRASHKKPRINEFEPPPNNIKISSLSSSKPHECSICNAEFNSGQALGGHMRRHRAANTALSLIPYGHITSVATDVDHNNNNNKEKTKNIDGLCLDLDLNLPAPPEPTPRAGSNHDQHQESNFKFKQRPSVHLSTLVDCHY